MKSIRSFSLAMFLIVASTSLFGQKVIVSGIVTDDNKEPLVGVPVYIKNTTNGIATDADGKYSISVPTGKHILAVQSLLYGSKELPIIIEVGKPLTVNIELEENSNLLNEVAVVGKTPVQQIRETPYNVTAVEAKRLHNLSSDINQVLNKTTGVRVRESGGTGSDFTFSLNGFSGNQVKFFLDGIPIDNYGPSFNLNNLPVNLAERIEVYKGVVPVHLGGDALGGAVNIVTNRRLTRFVDASYSFGSFNTHKASINARFVEKNGLVFNVNAFGNYSDNNYKVDVEIVDKTETGKYLPSQKYKRFHDGYKSGAIMFETGVQNKWYADHLLLGLSVSGSKNEIQQGITMQKVVGGAFNDAKSFLPSLKYRKSDLFTDGLTFDLSSSYNITNKNTVDTCSRVYKWDGTYSYRPYDGDRTMGELGHDGIAGTKRFSVYDEKSLVTSANLNYEIGKHHNIIFNYMFSHFNKKEDDNYKEIDLPGKPLLNKNILGLSYGLKALNDRFTFSTFGKMYDMYTKMIKDNVMLSSSSNNFGYGFATAYHITPWLQGKLSYEYAYRLPSEIEMLGDGILANSNVNLKPEKSDNLNIGLSFGQNLNKLNYLNIEGNFIYRNAKDFIHESLVGINTVYNNENNIKVVGLDGVVRYAYSDWLQFETNVTWQETTDINKKGSIDTNTENIYYGEQLANIPIFYTNSDLNFLLNDLFRKRDNLTLTVGTNYISSFYLKRPANGDKRSKKSIPEQFTQNLAIAYSLDKNRYNVSFECLNITDKKVYDYYMVQRPGRSFSIKFRYFFSK